MRRFILIISSVLAVWAGVIAFSAPVLAQGTSNAPAPADCSDQAGSFFGLPRWDKYLDKRSSGGVTPGSARADCTVSINKLSDLWRVVMAIIEILVRLAAFIAIAFVIYAGFQYIFSQGDSNRTAQARNTILYAVIGLIISVAAITVINLIGGTFS